MGDIQVLEGRTEGSQIYHCGDGWYYTVRETRNRRLRLRCRQYKTGCSGTASLNTVTGLFKHLNAHNHAPDRLFAQDVELRRRIINDAGSNFTGETPRQVLQRWKLRCDDVDLVKRFTMPRMRSSIAEARSANYPKIPDTLLYLGILLGLPNMRAVCETRDGRDMIFQGTCGVQADKTVSVVFVSMRMLQFLPTRQNLHMDGTFKKRPRKPASIQMFNIVTNYDGNVVGIARILMMRRTGLAYAALFQYLKELCPTLSPVRIHCDFERGLMNALRDAFPAPCLILGCLWHYGVAFSSQVRSYGLAPLAKENAVVFEFIRCFCAVPMLPYHRIAKGVDELWLQIQDFGWGLEFQPVYDYFQGEWLPRARELSVHGQPERTNNCSGSDNHSLANIFPKNRPNVWQMIVGFVSLEWLAWQDKATVFSGRDLHGPRRWTAVWNDRQIARHSRLLNDGEMTCVEFLHAASWHVLAPARHGLKLRDDNEDSDNESG